MNYDTCTVIGKIMRNLRIIFHHGTYKFYQTRPGSHWFHFVLVVKQRKNNIVRFSKLKVQMYQILSTRSVAGFKSFSVAVIVL